MKVVRFLQSVPGRIARVAVGMALIAYGAANPSLAGVVLMMVGIVPAVTGLLGVCLLEEVLGRGDEDTERQGLPGESRA